MRSRSRIPSAFASFAPVVAALCLLGPGPRPLTSQLLGPEFQVNSYTTNAQFHPAVAADASGGFVVVWGSNSQDGSSFGVFGQRFNSVGSPEGSEFQVNTYTTEFQSYSAVAADSSGNFVVVWQSFAQDGSNWGVFGQSFDSAGGRVGSEFQVNTYTTNIQHDPAVAADGLGSFLVAWESYGQDGSGWGVFGQWFNSAGSPLGSEFRVNSYTTGYQQSPAVAADGSGRFVVAWQSWQDASYKGVFGQRFNPAGSPLGSEFRVNSYTTGYQQSPAVAADSSGNFVVAWESGDQDGSSYGVFGQRFSSTGSSVGSEFQVNTYTTGGQYLSAVAADASGNFVVTWMVFGQDGSGWGVLGQRFNAVGNKLASEFQVNAFTTDNQRNPALEADGSGNFVVVWESYLQDGDASGVLGRQMNIGIFADGFELGDVCAWSAAVGSGDVCPP